MNNKNIDEITTFLKQQGFVFPGSQIYGGLANTWDYGPLGALLKENIKNVWIKEFVFKEINNYLFDSKILMNSNVWNASGHTTQFSDLLIENKVNGKRYRVDHLIEDYLKKNNLTKEFNFDSLSTKKLEEWILQNIKDWDGSKTNWSKAREFNLMFETQQGVVNDKKSSIYLRPETAQGIFINFLNVQRTMRTKIPFGIAQVGKSFRNEVTPGNFIFRTREFEQMELEYFTHPNDANNHFEYYFKKSFSFLKSLGLNTNNLKKRVHDKDELAHYSIKTIDIEYNFPFGWGEIMGISNRGDFDLKNHTKHSDASLNYLDPITNEKYIPFVVEPSFGLDRIMFALLVESYVIEKIGSDDATRIVLKLDKSIAPYRCAVLPLTKKQSDLAKDVYTSLLKLGISVTYDEPGSIGKRYRRQDAIGTPFCLTIDYDSPTDNSITIRDRDTLKQKRVLISQLNDIIL